MKHAKNPAVAVPVVVEEDSLGDVGVVAAAAGATSCSLGP
jgi:hypothetical protein